ncbi:MAG: methionyl-tRNA formyltransferase [Candidatus Yanofskybacteria bacterium CG10_big_fil_rev_8_21_14_0_10_37_15]|uniref:Methionyl-tRNA formyltransferase n=1 Tax=Candidatus Yanofskybacteria bacterium CG10_big_fil_rev_8_21_14_0_10_37_15 TaxID=1975097 RepID=A0A2H0R5I6_9BACT|nr:MAG: methionyl-tRNA formyltransferase [Candidatus Yanofskybacteria bacterium CG10_big_fil_rev_8_21_14_0_10_37_15]
MKNKLNIVFLGTPDFAIPTLKSLLNFGHNVVGVITQPEKPAGRAKIITPSPVKKFALEKHLSILEPHNLKKDEEAFENFKHLNPDLCVVAAYGKIIPSRYLDVPKYGFLNVHPSLLPKYRGPSPIQTAILTGNPKTGVSIMLIDEQVDHGPVLAQRTYNIKPTAYYSETEKDLSDLGAELLIETLPKYISGDMRPQEQDHNQATFTKMFTREDGKINWDCSAEKIYNQIRALNSEPGTWALLAYSVEAVSTTKAERPSGFVGQDKIINIKKAELRDGKLQIQIIQMEGKKEMSFEEFLRGRRNFDISQLK